MDTGRALFILAVVLAAALVFSQGGFSGLGSSGYSSGSGGFSFYTPPKTLPSDPKGIGDELDKIEDATGKIQDQINSSPLSNDMRLWIGSIGGTNPTEEYLELSLSSSHRGKVLLSGFTLRSAVTGVRATIGNGVELPFAGVVNAETAIFLSPGDTVYITTGRSPTGYSFRTNSCTGYFEQFQDFTPSLDRRCPLPRDEADRAIAKMTDACYDYVQTLSRCTMPIKNIPNAYLDADCRNFIDQRLSYKGCVDYHKPDSDFYKNEWRVFLNRDSTLWKNRRETIELLDQNGKVVAKASI